MRVQKLECGHGWRTATLDEFYAADDPQMVTAFWIHGNDVPSDAAAEQGHEMYHVVAGNGCRRVRMVIWSWPSDYIRGGLRNDAQAEVTTARISNRSMLGRWLIASGPKFRSC